MNEEFREQIGSVEAVLAGIEAAGYVVVERERWERVRAFASAATTVERHKREVFARDKFVHEEVEAMNARLQPIYAELTAGYDALQPGDLDEGADHQ